LFWQVPHWVGVNKRIGNPMLVEFQFKGLALSAIAHIKPGVPARLTGHPDTWSEGEGPEIQIESLTCGKSDAMFLLDSSFAGDIEDAAYLAATK
jgi:hypothetical protein